MSEEYDPDAFAIRVSQRLFHVLSGKAVDPGPIEPRTQREALLVEAARKEGRRDRMKLLESLKEEELKKAHEREESVQSTLLDVSSKLDDQFSKLDISTDPKTSAGPKPCESFRNAVMQCYEEHGRTNALVCSSQVQAFTECAKQLCNLSSN